MVSKHFRRSNINTIILFIATANTVFATLPQNQINQGADMTNQKLTIAEAHKEFAISSNNLVWDLLGKTNRTQQENDEMINAAHASLYHWSKIGTAINIQRGEWMVSHVYAVLGKPEQSLYHAKKCFELTEKNHFVDFDLAYACEGMARAFAVSGNKEECKKWLELAQIAADKIKNKEDRDIFISDFESGPWYKMK